MPIARPAGPQVSNAWSALVACALALSLTGCLNDDETDWKKTYQASAADGAGATSPVTVPPPASPSTNQAPAISGSPVTVAKVNQAYSFQPSASDPEGDSLTFQIANMPAWATFDATTGRLSGTPSSSSNGVFADVRISVSDGTSSRSLAPFSITVEGVQVGSATLSWQPPTSNTDGSPLTNLAGYVVRYGTSPSDLNIQVRIDNPGLVRYVVSDLTPATWYFHVAAFNTAGVESSPSATGSKTIS